MVDIAWPADLAPYRVTFYLQPHVGGSESPLTRVRKVYGLSAPRWVARMSFRAGYHGAPRVGEAEGFGPRLDALIADLEGGLNVAVFHDFRRPRPIQPSNVVSALRAAAAVKGADELTVGGFAPNSIAFSAGDYIGIGDERPHLVTGGDITTGAGTIMADATGVATVRFRPPLAAPVEADTLLTWPATGRFQLVSSDAGDNETTVGQLVEYVLDFVEDLR